MNDWHASFKAAFFSAWLQAGLPPPQSPGKHESDAGPRRCPIAAPPGPHASASSDGRPLASGTLDRVYGFGYFFGRTCGELFGLDEETVARRADFCGRFNLGISLFDYVCDEMPPPARDALAGLPAFSVFSGRRRLPAPALLGDVGEFLDRVAGGVLDEVAAELGPAGGPRGATGIWAALSAMFASQFAVSRSDLGRRDDLREVLAALRLKSSEPFRVMGEWMARGAGRRGVTPRRAAAFGRALGDCYWLVDDARDVWEDLGRGRWNFFLVAAATADPGVDLSSAGIVAEVGLTRAWRRSGPERTSSRQAVGRLAASLRSVGAGEQERALAASRFGASMARWLG